MLVDPDLSGLPAFLSPRPGLNSGFMIPQVTAAALVAENKQRAFPASVDSIPTSANQEDHVSMSAHAARRLMAMADNAAAIVGIEVLAAAQGCDFHAPLVSSDDLERVRATVRRRVPSSRGRPLHEPRPASGDRTGARRLVDRRARNPPALDRPEPSRERDWLTIRRGRRPSCYPSPTRESISPPGSKTVSSRPGSPARTPTGGSIGSMSLRTRLDATIVQYGDLAGRSIDVNRDPAGASLYPGQATTELCPTTTFDGEPLYLRNAVPDATEIESRKARWFVPYHEALAAELNALARLAQAGRAVRRPLDPFVRPAPVRRHLAPFQHRDQWRSELCARADSGGGSRLRRDLALARHQRALSRRVYHPPSRPAATGRARDPDGARVPKLSG